MRWLFFLLCGSLACGAVGCGDDDDDSGDGDADIDADADTDADTDADGDTDADTDADGDGDGDGDADAYPPPPYGRVVGDIIENLQFIGPDNSVVELAQFHRDPDAKLIMLFATAGWCYYCGEENVALVGNFDPNYRDDGLRILGIVFEDEQAEPADAAYADEYFGEYDAEYTYAADPYFVLGRYFDAAATPLNMFIRTDTMEIVNLELGWAEGPYMEIIEHWLYDENPGGA